MASTSGGGNHRRHLELSRGHGAGLVEHDRVDAAGGLQHLRPFDQDAELGSPPGSHQERGRRREAESAGAGDDQDRDRGLEGETGACAGGEPADQGQGRQAEHNRDEHRRDPVDEAFDRSLARLGLGHEPPDRRELGVGSDAGGLDDEPAPRVDGGPDHARARSDLERHRLAGDHARVDGGGALAHQSVRRHLLTGSYDEDVAHGQVLKRDPAFTGFVEHCDVARCQREQGAQGVPRSTSCSGLGETPREHEHRDDCCGLEVEVAADSGLPLGHEVDAHAGVGRPGGAEQERVDRPAVGGEHAEADQRVHRGRAVPEVDPGGAVERPGPPQHDRRGQGEREPLPVRELGGGHHRQHDDRHRHDHRDDQPGSQQGELTVVVAVAVAGNFDRRECGGVAGRLHRRDDLGRAGSRRDQHMGSLGGVVHGGLDTGHPVELLGDPRGARGAGHPADLELDDRGSAGAGHQGAKV